MPHMKLFELTLHGAKVNDGISACRSRSSKGVERGSDPIRVTETTRHWRCVDRYAADEYIGKNSGLER
jgi:hypothetical protein